MKAKKFKDLKDCEKGSVLRECLDCVKFKETYCLVLNEFHCFGNLSKPCPSKETSLYKWKETLNTILRYNINTGNPVKVSWLKEEIKLVEEKIEKDILKSFKEEAINLEEVTEL